MTGQTIKNALKSLGKSQREIADLMGITPQALTSILNADNIRTGTLERLAEVLSVPISFFYGEGNPSSVVATDNSVAAINSEVNVGDNERVKFLERLLEEKERTIQILMQK